MGYTLEFAEHDKYVNLVFDGELSIKELEIARREANLVLQDLNWHRLLIDASQTSSTLSVAENFEFTKGHPAKFPFGTRHAIIYSPELYEDFRFIVNVAQNRGVLMQLFTDRDEAVGWLLKG